MSLEAPTGSGPTCNITAVIANVSYSFACVSHVILATVQCWEMVIL